MTISKMYGTALLYFNSALLPTKTNFGTCNPQTMGYSNLMTFTKIFQ